MNDYYTRNMYLNDYYTRVAEHAKTDFLQDNDVVGIVLAGPGDVYERSISRL